MKVKYLFIILLSVLLVISISQIFMIPPYAGDIFKVYKSGYFRELDRGFNVINDSFINIKMMSRSAYAWIFLRDMQKKHNIKINVYNFDGFKVPAPGETKPGDDDKALRIINSSNPVFYSEIRNNKYYAAIPVFFENRCRFCHEHNKKNLAGIITFERGFDSHIYYSSERMIIFILVSLVLILLLYYIIRWEPGKAVKELFDK